MIRSILIAFFLCAAGAACAQIGNPLRSAGTEFFVAFPTNDPYSDNYYQYNESPNLYIYITAESNATVMTTMHERITHRQKIRGTNRWGFPPPHDTVITRTDKVTPFATLVIPVDTENNLYASGVVLPFSVHITATNPVRVFTLSHKPLTSDGVTALPVNLCDTAYVIAAQHNDPSGYTVYASEAAIIATQDSTLVHVTATANLMPFAPTPFQITLNKGQVWQLKADTAVTTGDLTGTIVTSSKPVVVLGGVERAWIYSLDPGTQSRDHMIEQMLPLKYLGKTFIATQTAQGHAPNRFKAVAAFDSTRVIVGDTVYMLQKQQFIDVPITSPNLLSSTKPICVMQEEPSSNGGLGDPDMEITPPLRGYDTSYIVYCPTTQDTTAYVEDSVAFSDTTFWRDTTISDVNTHVVDTTIIWDSLLIQGESEYDELTTYYDTTYQSDSVYVHNMTEYRIFDIGGSVFYEHYLTALLRTEDVPYFTMDNIRPPAKYFSPTDFCDYSAFTMNIQPGQHTVSAPHGFSLLCYGYGDADSYGYTAGLRIVPDDSLAAPSLAFGNVRIRKAVDSTATLTNAGIDSTYIQSATIIGPDSAYFQMLTNPTPSMLQGDSSISFAIQFKPLATRAYQAFLQICTEEDITLIPLSGAGIAAHLVLIPPTTNWGLRVTNQRYDSTVVLHNIGTDSAHIDSIIVIGDDTSVFSIVSSSFTLNAMGQRTLLVDFHPPAANLYVDSIAVISDSPDSSVQAALIGDAAGLSLVDDSIAFGTHLLTSDTIGSAFITNIGSNIVQIDSLSLVGFQANEFSILSPVSSAFPKFLAPNETLFVQVQFSALYTGFALAFIRVNAITPCAPIQLTGTVRDTVVPALESVSLPSVCVGEVIDTVIVFSNLGTSPLAIEGIQSSDPAIVAVTNEVGYPYSVMPDSTLQISLRVTPQRGTNNVSVSVLYQHAEDPEAAIVSQCIVTGLWDSASAAVFMAPDSVVIGNTENYCIPVHNNGTEPILIDSVVFADNMHFALQTLLPVSIAVGDSACIQFLFTPAPSDSTATAVHIVYVASCETESIQTIAEGWGISLNPQISAIIFSSALTCLQSTDTITIHNPSAVDGMITSITLSDTSEPFVLHVPQLPMPFTGDTTIKIPVTFSPYTQGNFSTNVLLNYSPRDTMQPEPFASLSGSAQETLDTAEIGTTYNATPSSDFIFNVLVSPGLPALLLHSVRGTITFDPSIFQVVGYDTTAKALSGFTIDTFAIDNSAGSVEFHAYNDVSTIPSNPILLGIKGYVLAGSASTTTEITPDIEYPDFNQSCVSVTNIAGLFSLDSLCGIGAVDFVPQTQLFQNTPNPVNSSASIRFSIPDNQYVQIILYNIYGEKIATLTDGYYPKGEYSLPIQSTLYSVGTYFYRMAANNFTATRQLTIIR